MDAEILNTAWRITCADVSEGGFSTDSEKHILSDIGTDILDSIYSVQYSLLFIWFGFIRCRQ